MAPGTPLEGRRLPEADARCRLWSACFLLSNSLPSFPPRVSVARAVSLLAVSRLFSRGARPWGTATGHGRGAWPQMLQRVSRSLTSGLCSAGSAAVALRLRCSVACGIFPDQGSNLCPLHQQADSLPLDHQGSPVVIIFSRM